MSVEFIRLFLIRDNRMLALRLGARMCQGTFFFMCNRKFLGISVGTRQRWHMDVTARRNLNMDVNLRRLPGKTIS